MKVLITGGAGFIGSHVVRLFVNRYPEYRIVNLDALSYAGNLENLRDVEQSGNYRFVKGDITERTTVLEFFAEECFDAVIHLAAESHVDRSILDPAAFIQTNIAGTVNLLDGARSIWHGQGAERRLFYQISTDEVYGSLGAEGYFREDTPYDPQSPYSASKAAADHFVRAYRNTYGLPVIISNCSNNYGPFQFPEKLIPLMIRNILQNKPLPVYGQGENVRDWLYVEDHAHAIDRVFHRGEIGETYNIGGWNEWKNIDLVRLLCRIMDQRLGLPEGGAESLVTFVTDRAGHDLRYAIDAGKIKEKLGWEPRVYFEEGLSRTVDWYLANTEWLDHVTSGAYLQYYQQQYAGR